MNRINYILVILFLLETFILLFWNYIGANINIYTNLIITIFAVVMTIIEYKNRNRLFRRVLSIFYPLLFIVLFPFYILLSGAIIPTNIDYFLCYSLITINMIGLIL